MSHTAEEVLKQYEWCTKGVHDPTIVKGEDDMYYMFSTDTNIYGRQAGAAMRRSKDLIHWDYIGTALDGVPGPAHAWTGAVGLWAPEVKKADGVWYMYYSASTFGSRISCIGLATAPYPAGPWKDRGIVVQTDYERCTHNAIDANLIQTKEGDWWLCYGSFFGGIYLVEINITTGFTKKKGDLGIKIAQRPLHVQDGAIEGPYIYYNREQDYYYLFVSYDSLLGSYNIRTARSKTITGPYLDFNHREMIYPDGQEASQIGTKILGSYQFQGDIPWIAPGHNSIFTENGIDYIVHHTRLRQKGRFSYGFIRRLFWLPNGWPVAAPEYWHQSRQSNEICHPNGKWKIIQFTNDSILQKSHSLTLTSFTPIKDSFYNLEGFGQCFIFPCYDWKTAQTTLGISGISNSGIGYFGKKETVV